MSSSRILTKGVMPEDVTHPTSAPVPAAGNNIQRELCRSGREAGAAVFTLAEARERITRLEQLVRDLNAGGTLGDLDRVLNVAETARAIGKSPLTLAKRLRDAHQFERWQMAILVQKDPTGHWVSSPRRVARWKQVMFRNLQTLAGGSR